MEMILASSNTFADAQKFQPRKSLNPKASQPEKSN